MNDFLCLYQWGSRLFGTNESSSDCDMVAVIRGYKFGQLKGKQDHAPYWHKVQVTTEDFTRDIIAFN
jgi:hypothetical protein